MTRKLYVCFFAAALCSFPQTYSSYMRQGAEAFNQGALNDSIRAYENAVRANPSDTLGKLHLAFVLLRQPDSRSHWEQVRQLSSEVLQVEPRNDYAEWNLALLDTMNRQPAGAKSHCAAILTRQPQHAPCLYTAATSSWMAAYPKVMEARQRAGMNLAATGPMPDLAAREALHRLYDADLASGLAQLTQLRQLHPDHADAMAYQNLIQRTRASIAPSEREAKALTAEADRYMQEALALRGKGRSSPAPLLNPQQLPPMAELPKLPPPPPPPPPPPAR